METTLVFFIILKCLKKYYLINFGFMKDMIYISNPFILLTPFGLHRQRHYMPLYNYANQILMNHCLCVTDRAFVATLHYCKIFHSRDNDVIITVATLSIFPLLIYREFWIATPMLQGGKDNKCASRAFLQASPFPGSRSRNARTYNDALPLIKIHAA